MIRKDLNQPISGSYEQAKNQVRSALATMEFENKKYVEAILEKETPTPGEKAIIYSMIKYGK